MGLTLWSLMYLNCLLFRCNTCSSKPSHNNLVREAVNSLRSRGLVNKKTASDLVETKVRTPHLYLLPKIHKRLQNPPGRPIVSSNGAPTERISAFVNQHLQPLVKLLPSYIKDTKDFLRNLQTLPTPLPANTLLFTMDVVGLYTNIPHNDGLSACATALNCRTTPLVPTDDIVRLAQLVLELNNFQFGSKHYVQVRGTAMGTRMAPSYANLFMGCLEEKILETAPDGLTPAFYRRFIDDIFGVWLHGEAAFKRFAEHANETHESIRFTYSLGRSVQFLDVTSTINNGRISTDLYIKPTDTHQYLLPSSNHPPHVHRHLPYGLALRLRVIVSDDEILEQRFDELTKFLIQRGYTEGAVNEQLEKVRQKSRNEVLLSTKKSESTRTPLVCTWDTRLPPLNFLLRLSFPILQSNDRLRTLFSELPLVSYRRPKNLRDLLVKTTTPTARRSDNQPAGTHPCKAPRCKTYAMISSERTPVWDACQNHEVRRSFSCGSSSVVYVVSCSACNAVYIGETGCTLRTRMTQHRSSIRHKEDTPVAEHFGLQPGHQPRVMVLESTPREMAQRRIVEAKWIARFRRSSSVSLLNRDDGIDIIQV